MAAECSRVVRAVPGRLCVKYAIFADGRAQAKSVATDAYDLVLLARAESVREPAFDGFCRFLYTMTRPPVASSSLSPLATAMRTIFREGASMEFDESCN
jgi:hypothetical protein